MINCRQTITIVVRAASLSLMALLAACGQSVGVSDSGDDVAVDAGSADAGPADAGSADVAIDAAVIPDAAFDVPEDSSLHTDVVPDGSVIDASAACNTTTNEGASIPYTAGTGSPPAPLGGLIVPGHYLLTSAVQYGGLDARSTRQAMDVTATTINAVGDDSGHPEQRVTLAYVTSGTALIETQMCPGVSPAATIGYSVDSAQHIILYVTVLGSTYEFTFSQH